MSDHGFVRVWATCDPHNQPSIRVAERLGMLCEGRLRNYKRISDTEWRDRLMYVITPYHS